MCNYSTKDNRAHDSKQISSYSIYSNIKSQKFADELYLTNNLLLN